MSPEVRDLIEMAAQSLDVLSLKLEGVEPLTPEDLYDSAFLLFEAEELSFLLEDEFGRGVLIGQILAYYEQAVASEEAEALEAMEEDGE